MTTSPQPTREAIEAGARALVPGFGYMDAIQQRVHLGVARDILTTAALPAIRAQVLAEVAEAIEAEASRSSYRDPSHATEAYLDAASIVRALANPTPDEPKTESTALFGSILPDATEPDAFYVDLKSALWDCAMGPCRIVQRDDPDSPWRLVGNPTPDAKGSTDE